MDDLKFNKLAAAFLLAVLLAMGGYKLSEIMIPHNELAQNSYPIEVTESKVPHQRLLRRQVLNQFLRS